MSTWPEVIQRANTDPAFRAKLKADPAATCKQAGCAVPAGATVEIIEQDRDDLHLFLGTRTKDANINGVLERAEQDAAYRQKLLDDPKGILEVALAQQLPRGTQVHVHEPKAKSIRLRIGTPPESSDELSDQQLEAVAGGGFFANVRNAVGDFFCRDQPIALTDVSAGGKIVTGVGYYTTRSGNIESASAGIVI